jgi:hypothetical protein
MIRKPFPSSCVMINFEVECGDDAHVSLQGECFRLMLAGLGDPPSGTYRDFHMNKGNALQNYRHDTPVMDTIAEIDRVL